MLFANTDGIVVFVSIRRGDGGVWWWVQNVSVVSCRVSHAGCFSHVVIM